jgi:hypothetical protein
LVGARGDRGSIDDALRRELPEASKIEGDEGEADILFRRREAPELTDVLPAQPSLDHDLVVGEVLLVRDVVQPAEGAAPGKGNVAVRLPDAVVVGEGLAIVEHHRVGGERLHDAVDVVGVLGGVVRVQQRPSPRALRVVDAHRDTSS